MAALFTTDPTFEDGSPRRLAGVSRRPYSEYANTGGYIMCSCGSILQTVQQGHEHWLAGHFDFTLYHVEESERAA